jgi:hypothetical protein
MKASLIALIAAVLLGLTSTALATQPFGATVYQPVFQGNVLSAKAPAGLQNGRTLLSRGLQPFAAEEKARFDRMERPE